MNIVHWIIILLVTALSLATAGHALLYKRRPGSAIAWIAVSLLYPLAGPILYLLFGINRVQTRAKRIDLQPISWSSIRVEGQTNSRIPFTPGPPPEPGVAEIARISDAVAEMPLARGNRVEPLYNGEEAYPAMLKAIQQAGRSIFLVTYIFETNDTGRQFIDALARAVGRGVDVRVIIDGIGAWYSRPKAMKLLRESGVPVSVFLPPKLFPPTVNINLRNHRKILAVDGRLGFIGGMNIGDRHLAAREENPSRVVDAQFQVEGPVVAQMEKVFLEDWAFSNGLRDVPQAIGGPPNTEEAGTAVCRCVVDGPNEDMDKLSAILVGAVSSALRGVDIMTPYFLPSDPLVAAMQTAALRGVNVSVLLPSKNNLPFVHWASRNMLWEVLRWGVRVYYQPPPFVHTKLLLVDGQYALVGSANIDPRSLRLNFELMMEVYDNALSRLLADHVEHCRSLSKEVSLEEVDSRPLITRTRDSLAWLFSPYL